MMAVIITTAINTKIAEIEQKRKGEKEEDKGCV